MARKGTTTTHAQQREPLDRGRPIPHGTLNGYVNYKCSCDSCRDAKATYERDQRARRQAQELANAGLRRVRGRLRVVH